MFGDICAIFVVLVVLAALLQGLHAYQRIRSPHPEIMRKLVHGVMGGVTLSFPWLFQSAVSVIILGVIAAAGLTYIKKSQKLRSGVGSVLCAVKRQSYGEVSFTAAIAVLFLLAGHNPLLYSIPVLILTLADSSSALVGIFLGKHKFTTSDGTKTAEGSLAFFIATVLSTTIPLLLYSSLPAANILLIGLLLGGLVMMFEAIAWRGLDNFLIPISAYILLSMYMNLSADGLLTRLFAAGMLLGFAFIWRKRTTLHDGAAIGAALSCYVSAAAGGIEWLLAPLMVFSLYKFALPARYRRMPRVHSVRAVVSVASTGLLWLLAAKLTDNQSLFFPYTLSFASNFVMISSAHLQLLRHHSVARDIVLLVVSSVLTWLMFFLPYLAIMGCSAMHLQEVMVALPLIGLSALSFYCYSPRDRAELSGTRRWARQFGIAACISPLALCF